MPEPAATPEPSVGLPEILEATPVPASSSTGVVDGGQVAHDDAAAGLAALAATGPQLPKVTVPNRQPAAAMVYETTVDRPVATPTSRPSRRRGRRTLKLVATLVVLAGLVAAGVVFGRPYLLPGDWDEATQPYADAVETARGVEFVEPLRVIAEPTPQYTDRMSAELTGAWSQDQAMWRALGLMRGPATEATVAEALSGWQDAVYSSVDGQVYRDEAVAGPQSDAQITEAMATASLDQEFGWSTEQPTRTLDDAAQTGAEVIRQTREVLASSAFAVELEPVEPAALTFVPPVVGYRVLAPAAFAEFENGAAGTENALSGIGTGGPGPMASEVPVVASNPTMTATDVVVGSPRAMDRSFWYLVLAGFLDPRTSYDATDAIVEGAVTMAERGGTQCAYATFSGGDTEQTATLRAALEAWSTAASATLSSTFSVLPDGALQVVGCDPGVGFDTPTRLGVARELVGWRIAELATIEAVAVAQGTATDFEAAWAIVEASDVPVQLAALPPETTPQDAAKEARAAVDALFTPAG
jgi:hypothetical protein